MTRSVELIHGNLWTNLNENKYVITFIGDFIHFTVAYALESKLDVIQYVKMFHAMDAAHFKLKISRFCYDKGREYMSNKLMHFFKEQRVQFGFIIRHTLQQNGNAY